MAHELEIVNGNASMMYVGETPWHGLGTKLTQDPTIEEAIVAAGLDWKVSTQSLYLSNGQEAPSKAVVRDIDSSILGVVGSGYNPLQNIEAFQFFNDFLATKQATLHTAGSLRDGKRVWVLAKINRDPMEIVKGDEVEKYVLLSNSHDGTMSVRTGFTPVRVVCANTLAFSINNVKSSLIRLKHTKSLKQNLEKISEIMNLANQTFEATAEQYRILASTSISQQDLEKYVKIVFAGPQFEKMELAGKKPARDVLPKVIELFENGRGSQIQGVRGTVWGAYNAINEYLGYAKGNDQQARLDKYWFGDSAAINQKALDTALDMAA